MQRGLENVLYELDVGCAFASSGVVTPKRKKMCGAHPRVSYTNQVFKTRKMHERKVQKSCGFPTKKRGNSERENSTVFRQIVD